MDSVSVYSFSSLLWHSVQGIPLVIWPQAINGLLTMDSQTMQPSSGVENYFARSLGFALLALGAVTVVLTGALPLTSMVETPADSVSPYASATLLITTLHHGATAFYCWSKYNTTSQTGYILGFIGSVSLAAFGTLCLVFGNEKARISKRTGADKRTSGWPFPNAEAEKRKKKGL
ncbi:hypothetical protein AB5N19_07322 [Seiridium cardinale]|uniref:Uncharacterized protein n=2 Tax=Seiridium TaxID=138063 RepID=A0ABR2UQM1_9PEZI